MNRSALKKYAPQARLDFIAAVTLRARRLGLDPALPVNIEQTGDVLLIGGQPFPASIGKQLDTLALRIHQQGFRAVVEALAYTWFNRLVAIRFMELKGYFSHGYRVLSHPTGQHPEILDNVQHLELLGMNKDEIIRLKTAGNQDEALYREILIAQCHELHSNMPFLFEALDDATELLLPDNLLRTDSPIARLVGDIEESDWQEVEVIGWLYQFYISEKKGEVIGKVVKSEDIPAATQLFTPNWIVQYLVQNSLGRLWLMANPNSSLKEKMPYYIEPAEQAPEVQDQLDALIKVRMDADGGTLNPESLTVLDPACGSGHILVEAYNLLRAIYQERGYRLRDIPRLILQKNLFGLDIDDRAAQLAGFALLMKAREDDRRLFDEQGNPPHLNVKAIQQSAGLPDEEMARVILNAAIQIEGGDAFHSGQLFGGGQLETRHSSGLTVFDIRQLVKLFENGKTFGSLISVPDLLKAKLSKIIDLLATVRNKGDNLSRSYAEQVLVNFALPASLLALQYDTVVANPPYMGGKGMNAELKEFAKREFPDSKIDLFAMFIERGLTFCTAIGFNSMITMQSWMFLSSYQKMREKLLANRTIHTMVHLGARAFSEISGEVVQVTAFITQSCYISGLKPVFFRLVDGGETDKNTCLLARERRFDQIAQDEFKKIPGSPLAYWIGEKVINLFSGSVSIGDKVKAVVGLQTGDNDKFLRYWYEVSLDNIGFDVKCTKSSLASKKKWRLYNKAGGYRKWYGNFEYVVNWFDDGSEIKNFCDEHGSLRSRPQNEQYYFKECISWSDVTMGDTAFRFYPAGVISDACAHSFHAENQEDKYRLLAYCNTVFVRDVVKILNPTIHFHVGYFNKLPYPEKLSYEVADLAKSAIAISHADWSKSELSWEFSSIEWLRLDSEYLRESMNLWMDLTVERIRELKDIEEKNNKFFIDSYSLQDTFDPSVREDEVALTRGSKEKGVQLLLSYVIGCMMGRYSLDEDGLIYAYCSDFGFDPSRYPTFAADADGIIPVTDESWFEDDAAERVREFIKVVWGGNTLVDNMEWLADSLGRKTGESADEAIRRYLSTSFYKDHLQTYKKRPIYWLFSSGKQKAFECLVYLHRYNEGTLSRMRMEYVVPLQSRMQARIDKLADDINSATGSAQQKALQKRKGKFTKQLEELRRFDETLRPYADQRIALNLDDGVKVNYGKFGDLLAEVKVITGGKDD